MVTLSSQSVLTSRSKLVHSVIIYERILETHI